MKRIAFILLVVLPFLCLAQKQGNIWYFGKHTGLNFNSGLPIVLTDGQTYSPDGTPVEGTAVVSDSSGSLLFYTNGMKIWNKSGQLMPNGDSLLGNFSSTQAAIIIPQPGSSRYFYVFTTDCFQNNLQNGLRYSIVDICLDNGFGDVISQKKNLKLLDTVAEKLTAVRHSNGLDYWIISHKYYSDAFYSYRLSSIGVTDTVISHIGSRHPNIAAPQTSNAAIGELKASSNGNKLAIVNGNAGAHVIAEYFDFDKNTGVVSNCLNLQTNLALQQQYYGVSFSPDNSKLYIACALNLQGVYQFDLNAGGGNADSIIASRTNIASNNYGYNGLQLASNGRIYISPRGINLYLAVINNPNNVGPSCNFKDSAIYLNGDTCGYGLPNFVDSYSYSNTVYDCSAMGVNEANLSRTINVFPNPSNGKFEIETNLKINSIAIYNVLGELIYFTKNTSKQDNEIDLSSEPNGVYFVIARTDAGIINRKIIVEK